MKTGNTRAPAGTLGTVGLKHVSLNDDLALAHLPSVSDSVKGTHPYEWRDNRKVTHPGCSETLA